MKKERKKEMWLLTITTRTPSITYEQEFQVQRERQRERERDRETERETERERERQTDRQTDRQVRESSFSNSSIRNFSKLTWTFFRTENEQ